MPPASSKTTRPGRHSEPAWDIAYLFPAQGQWTEEEYLALDGNRLVEFSDGYLEVLPMPTTSHQLLSSWLYGLFQAFVSSRNLGLVLYAPLRVRLRPGKYREPDIVFLARGHRARIGEDFWQGADLVVEVVSEDDKSRRRDLTIKRREYARAGISEYWIVDPRQERITVLRLAGNRYLVHGTFAKGTTATSLVLRGLEVDVAATFSRRLAFRQRKRR